ncbi:MAG: hypothetical protein ACREBS_01135 [Nitrososphaerales archaeon]
MKNVSSLGETTPAVEKDSTSVALQLLDVEILYLISYRPLTLNNLVDSFNSTFDLFVSPSALFGRLRYLERADKLKSFQKLGVGSDYGELYSITLFGSKKLSGNMQSISEIALTMRLGINPKVIQLPSRKTSH